MAAEPENELRERASARLKKKDEFAHHLLAFVLVNGLLVVVWALTGHGFFWPAFPWPDWGIGLTFHPGQGSQRGHARSDGEGKSATSATALRNGASQASLHNRQRRARSGHRVRFTSGAAPLEGRLAAPEGSHLQNARSVPSGLRSTHDLVDRNRTPPSLRYLWAPDRGKRGLAPKGTRGGLRGCETK